jgi:glycosyltransferase involved in cell wall biosynthesis/tetratricopeptide (TPR) repeat protein
VSDPFISCAIICGDTGTKTIGQAIASLSARKLVDEFVVMFNGRVGRGLIPTESNGIPVHIFDQKWKKDFGAARQESFEKTQGQWVIRIDTDDVVLDATHPEVARKANEMGLKGSTFTTGSREHFRQELMNYSASSGGPNCIISPYYYIADAQDRPILEHPIRRMVQFRDTSGRQLWRWVRRIHEDLEPLPESGGERFVVNPALITVQKNQDHSEDRGARNKEIHDEFVKDLEAMGTGASYRDWYNAGAMSCDAQDFKTARRELETAIERSRASSDPGFLLAAQERMVTVCLGLDDKATALDCAFSILRDDPASRHGHLMVSSIYYKMGDYAKCLEWFQIGIPRAQSFSFAPMDKVSRFILPMAYAADSLSRMGRFPEAREWISKASTELPGEPSVARLQMEIGQRQEEASLTASVRKVVEHQLARGAKEKAQGLLISSPSVTGVDDLWQRALRPDVKRAITIYAPQYVEQWEPDWIETEGTGGSEEAIVYFGEELVRRGYEVTAYTPVPNEQTFRGVKYRPLKLFNQSDPFDVLICHRTLVSNRARTCYVWHHDHQWPGQHPGEALKAIRNLFVSQWQAEQLGAQLQAKSFNGIVMGNGVPESEAPLLLSELGDDPLFVRHPHRAIYASQPTRGLGRLLDVWPQIREKVPDAELFVFYGFKTVDELAKTDKGLSEETKKLHARIRSPLPGVNYVGRVPQVTLMAELRKAGVFVYPCTYPEVFCIAGVRASAAGCVPVFTPAGALNEVQMCPAVDPMMFTHEVVRAMTGVDHAARVEMRARTLERHSWAKVVDRFLADLAAVTPVAG